MTSPIPLTRAVVFDMGGVLVELGPSTDLIGADPVSPDAFWSRWLASPAVRDFETGRCSAEQFGERFVDEAGLATSGIEFVARLGAWPKGLFPGAAELVTRLRDDLDVALLSNTNELHWYHQVDHHKVRGLCTRNYLSFELGIAKPDAEIFHHVVADLGHLPGQIVFLDDNRANVDAAASIGIDSALVEGVDQASAELAARGLLNRL